MRPRAGPVDSIFWPIRKPPATICCAIYRLAPEKITVAPLGVDPVFFDIARRRRPERYFLAVSTLHPHKNLDG